MSKTHRKVLTPNAQKLRREMTKEEKHLWYDYFRKIPFTVHRQKVFGPYIVDFYIAQAKLVVELDGSQHYEEENRLADRIRDGYLNSMGITVLRFPNSTVWENFEGVCDGISSYLEDFVDDNLDLE